MVVDVHIEPVIVAVVLGVDAVEDVEAVCGTYVHILYLRAHSSVGMTTASAVFIDLPLLNITVLLYLLSVGTSQFSPPHAVRKGGQTP